MFCWLADSTQAQLDWRTLACSTFLGSMTLYGSLSAGQTGEREREGEETEDAPVVMLGQGGGPEPTGVTTPPGYQATTGYCWQILVNFNCQPARVNGFTTDWENRLAVFSGSDCDYTGSQGCHV